MADINLTYKIIILEILNKADTKLSNRVIVDFFLEFEYTDYFSAEMAINELVDSNMIDVVETHGSTNYSINEEGKKTLGLFQDRINSEIEEDIKSYFNKNMLEIREEQEVTSNYSALSSGGYMVNCRIRDIDKARTIYEVNCVVPTKEQAEAICNNWQAKYEEIYFQFLEGLTV